MSSVSIACRWNGSDTDPANVDYLGDGPRFAIPLDFVGIQPKLCQHLVRVFGKIRCGLRITGFLIELDSRDGHLQPATGVIDTGFTAARR